MDVAEGAGLAVAALAAGAINAVAGGGSLISFPALVAAGYPAKTANVTNTVALWPGYAGGSFGYREELRTQRRRLVALLGPSVAGALAGSLVLLSTPEAAFDAVVPFLIVFACVLMAAQDRVAAWATRHRLGSPDGERVPLAMHAATFVLAMYGAYFGAALGILMLAFLGVFLPDDIQRSNALKGMLSLVINGVAVAWFALFGPVEWAAAAVMAVAAVVGGYAGVGVARLLDRQVLRVVVIAYGLVAAALLFAGL
jgi:uncharacterized membrane protein YfcA